MSRNARIILLHHSTGNCIWKGGVPEWFEKYNAENGAQYRIEERAFPQKEPYGWKNYPYDYWNIWVKNAGDAPFQGEPTLEMLTPDYDVIVFKHCYPVSQIQEDGTPDIESEEKTLANYKLQYTALREKLLQFPDTRFVVWTGAALVKEKTTEENGRRAMEFFEWVKNEWDQPDDNIYVWDFFALETEGGPFLLDAYSSGPGNSHPSEAFSQKCAPLFSQRIVDVIEGKGDTGSLTGS